MKFSPCFNNSDRRLWFHLFCQRSRSDVIQIELLTIFGFQQTLNAIQIVGVFFCSSLFRPSFPAPWFFDVFGIGYRRQLCFAQYCRMPAALFMLSALKARFPLLSKLVNDASDQPPSCVVLFWLPSSLAALESASFRDAACTLVEINALAAMAQHRRCLTVSSSLLKVELCRSIPPETGINTLYLLPGYGSYPS